MVLLLFSPLWVPLGIYAAAYTGLVVIAGVRNL